MIQGSGPQAPPARYGPPRLRENIDSGMRLMSPVHCIFFARKCTHMHAFACMCKHVCTCMHAHAYACTCICICTHMHAYARIWMHMHVHVHAYSCACMHIHVRAYACTCTRMQASACICMHMHTTHHPQTHTTGGGGTIPWSGGDIKLFPR